MKTKSLKRFLAVFLAVAISTFGLCVVNTSAESFNGFIYEVKEDYNNETQYVVIKGYEGSASTLEIPSEIDGLPVTRIDYSAFSGNETITSAIIPDSVTSIRGSVFQNCKNLAEITLPDSLKEVGSNILQDTAYEAANREDGMLYCGNFLLNAIGYEIEENITVKEGTTFIADFTFFSSDITSVTLPSSVKYIGDSAFGFCKYLTSVTVPEGVVSIGSQSFAFCDNLETIDLPETLTYIGSSAFAHDFALKSIDIPAGVTEFEINMLSDCTGITEFEIKDTVTDLGISTFSGTGIKSIHIPASVEEISSSFDNCAELDVITVDENNPYYYAKDNVLYEKAAYEGDIETILRITCDDSFTSFVIPEYVGYIESEALSGNTALKELTLSSEISYLTLFDCYGLENIYVHPDNEDFTSVDGVLYSKDGTILEIYPAGKTAEEYTVSESVTTIGANAISNNANLKTVTIPATVTEVNYSAISDCENLTTINLEATTGIDSSAIARCDNLNTINFAGTVAEWEALDLFFTYSMCEKGIYAYCSDGTVEIAPPAYTEPVIIESTPVETETAATGATEVVPTESVPAETETTATDATESVPAETETTATTPESTTAQPETTVTQEDDTTPTTTTTPDSEFELGDVNMDGKINIKDATTIQKVCAKMMTFTAEQEILADFNLDSKINVKDATQIQKKLANLI